MVLSALSKVRVQFRAADPRNAAVREFLFRITTPKAIASNPKCEVIPKVRIDRQPPVVELTFLNGQVEVLDCSKLRVTDILERINAVNQKITIQTLLKNAGEEKLYLETRAGPEQMKNSGPSICSNAEGE
ncbi:hypothetical protein CYMTET_22727 [Cymbomonas tetramitiformis]|uniref:Large ribosomal subunit protein mL53 n=1 Tax=Cymbomonas tetramitiformis TaxID=36881 RepID=A0AAE0BYW3_9CHLO|nr:hypothetical protein CYMTET_45096 [Cymbomonas tetramitiformis]KAK3268788.1 hypothetical protein CYMTET_22727 [Cymbomonas tetramitiformis]